jgi:subtilisin family serine protease
MNFKLIIVWLFITAIHFSNVTFAQTSANTKSTSKYENWYNLDPDSDNKFGMSVDKAYNELLKDKKSKPIIVAIIDSGVDIMHEDLQGKIWTNTAEIPGNGIDDDHNGYVDDINGWNFLGNKKGENILYENSEICRLYKKLDPKYKDLTPTTVKTEDTAEYHYYQKVKARFDEESEKAKKEADKLATFAANYQYADSIVCSYLKKNEFTFTELNAINPDTAKNLKFSKDLLLFLYKQKGFNKNDFKEYLQQVFAKHYCHYNLAFNPRELVGDNPDDINDSIYGNNDVIGSRPDHGTHVSGIVAANRNNGIGVKGVADNVQIMALRVVPDGDERDKDIALAIRYAAKMGARVINMSFGKEFSPQKKFVDEAVKFATAKDVLIVHAAGNDGKDIDTAENYPSNTLLDKTKITSNWITVGASSEEGNKNLPASFSNYGKNEVDVFAPGVSIYNLKPGNQYKENDGTSMASPMVTGVAAMLRSYFPQLTAAQVKECICNSVEKFSKKVYLPEEGAKKKTKIRFKELSVSGGVVNAYNAVKLAEKMTNAVTN